jgi:hypothetical protein
VDRDAFLLMTYSLVVTGFVSVVALTQRGYQDAWILEDILVPTLGYFLAYSLIVVSIDDNRIVAILASSFLVILNCIPNLKYEFFYGNFDSSGHYGFVRRLLSLGHVPQTGFYAQPYGDSPGMQILMASLSLVPGVSANAAIKLYTSTICAIIPLIIYLASNGVFEKRIQRYILLASSLPAVADSYVLGGGTFGLALYLAFFCVLFRGVSRDPKGETYPYLLVLLLLGYALIFSHPVTVVFLLFVLTAIAFFFMVNRILKNQDLTSCTVAINTPGILLVLAVSFLAFEIFKARFVLQTLVGALERIIAGSPGAPAIPPRFFELPLFGQFEFLLVIHVKDFVVILLGVLGFIVLLRTFRRRSKVVFNRFYLPMIVALVALASVLVLQLATRFGEIGYARPLAYAMIFQPFLVGLVVWSLDQRLRWVNIRHLVLGVLLFLLLSLSMIQFFPCQPIVPRANLLSANLSQNEYVFDFRQVNTVYDVRVILFAEAFAPVDSRIASDTVTMWQIYGFADSPFSARHTRSSPLEPETEWQSDIVLLHYDGIAGSLNEKAEYRTYERIERMRDNSNLVYYNGGSFIMISIVRSP